MLLIIIIYFLRLCKDELDICFYGGEPLLRPKIIYKVMDMLPDTTQYILQSNCTLLKEINLDYLFRFRTIMCSIDGTQYVTDSERGSGTYEKVINNIYWLRQIGYKGDICARMTVSKYGNVYENVTHLLSKGLFSHVHWQLDMLWDSDMNSRWGDFIKWRDENYNPNITKLINLFLEKCEKDREVLPIAPFQGIIWSLLNNETNCGLRCGCGIDTFCITTGGKITSCPIADDFEALCHLTPKFNPEKVRNKDPIEEPCTSCDYYGLCGGRCLYTNKTKWWGEDGFAESCKTTKHLIDELKRILPRIKELIEKGIVKKEAFNYPDYNNSVEVIP